MRKTVHERKTPLGLFLPGRTKVTLEQRMPTSSENIWQGKITLTNPKRWEKQIAKRIKFRKEIFILIAKFLEHWEKDKSKNSSLSMLLEEEVNGEPVVLQVSIGHRSELFVQAFYNFSNNIEALRKEGKIIPKQS